MSVVGWFDVFRNQGFVNSVRQSQHDGQQQNHPCCASPETITAIQPGQQANVHASAENEQYEGCPDRVRVLKHHTQLGHRQHRSRIGRNRHCSHVEWSQWIVVIECVLQTIRRNQCSEQSGPDEADQNVHERS